MNTNIYNRDNWVKVVRPLRTDDDKDACIRLLTSKENETLCHGVYDSHFINKAIEQSHYIIFRHRRGNVQNVVAFALLEVSKSKIADILLVCTVPNKERFGQMIAYDIFAFAVYKKCKKMYTEPRTDDLRSTFIKYGFSHLRGIPGINEVLEKPVTPMTLRAVSSTLKIRRSKPNKPTVHDNEIITVFN